MLGTRQEQKQDYERELKETEAKRSRLEQNRYLGWLTVWGGGGFFVAGLFGTIEPSVGGIALVFLVGGALWLYDNKTTLDRLSERVRSIDAAVRSIDAAIASLGEEDE